MANLKGVTKSTWIRLIVLAITFINLISATVFGHNILPFEDDQLYDGVSTVITVISAVWTSWKNNSFTKPAQEADKVMKVHKEAIK